MMTQPRRRLIFSGVVFLSSVFLGESTACASTAVCVQALQSGRIDRDSAQKKCALLYAH